MHLQHRLSLAAMAVVGALLLNTPSRAASAAGSGLSCDLTSLQSAAPADTTLVSADHLDAPVPHCKVEGYVTTTNPGPNRANFRLQLPDKSLWKGRYYFIGLGGTAGYVPTNSELPPGNPMVKGFAVAGTDTGVDRTKEVGWSFLADPAKAMDHTHRAAHLTTVAAQAITRAYYGVEKMWRYHTGCSGGGRMGGEAAMMHPEDYDGILLGQSRVRPPGMIDSAVMMKFIHAVQQMNREPGAWVSPAKLQMVDRHVTAACDMTDGAKDDMVWDHQLCHYDVAKLKCKGADAPDCLTQPEITSIKNILDGPRGPRGELLAEPMPITNMSVWATFTGATPPPWSLKDPSHKPSAAFSIATTTGMGFLGPDFDVLKFDLKDQKALDRWQEGGLRTGFGRAPDLTPISRTGGKVLMWVGESDPCCSSAGMRAYMRYLADTYYWEGMKGVLRTYQLYRLPGAGHCGGGTGPGDGPDQLLWALVDWVEQGKTPGGVVAHRGADRVKLAFADESHPVNAGALVPVPTGPSRDFLLCPFPQVSVFDKSKANIPGAVYEAANWSCRASRS